MKTRIQSIQEIKSLLSEITLNKTSKITEIADNSVLSGLLFANAKLIQKIQKDTAIIESQLFPEQAYGDDLDVIASRQGVLPRYGATVSSVYIRLVATPGTQYIASQNIFKSKSGIQFVLAQDIIQGNRNYQDILDYGFTYVKLNSTTQGSQSNVDPYSIIEVSNKPNGHQYCLNEVYAEGGRDSEQDDLFRKRIIETPNYLTSGTLSKLTQIFNRTNVDVLSVKKGYIDFDGKIALFVYSCSGKDFTEDEFKTILNSSVDYLSLTDINSLNNNNINIKLINASYEYIDIDFQCELNTSNVTIDNIVKDIQIQISKYLDWRVWGSQTYFEWVKIFDIIRFTNGVTYLSEKNFYPFSNFKTNIKLPRLRGFVMRDLNGNVIIDNNRGINPVYYNSQENDNYSLYSTNI